MSLAQLEATIGYSFKNSALLECALTHPSLLQEKAHAHDSNQRLEFLGDSVLSLILAEKLYHHFPKEREGMLAKSRSALAKGSLLAELGKTLELHSHIRLSHSERAAGGHLKTAALEDTFEALIGAIYLDSDFPTTRQTVLIWLGEIETLLKKTMASDNPKGRLQEIFQQQDTQKKVVYKLVQEEGPDHQKVFTVAVSFNDEKLGQGMGSSKKEAEENAARAALELVAKQ